MAIDNLPASEEGHLSGAYIRSLVKQLTSPKSLSTKTNKTPNNNETNISGNNTNNNNNNNIVGEYSEKLGMAKQPNQQQQQQGGGGGSGGGHKKQVRRRLHTSRPYQERLLNMAEARKEIVTALKFHRAAMKQANEKKQQQQQLPIQHHGHHPQFALGVVDHEEEYKPNNYSSSSSSPFTNYTPYNNYPSYNDAFYPWNNNNNNNNNNNQSSSPSLIEPPPINYETLNLPLPNQTLGLNLNLQAFTNLDTSFSHHSVTNYTTPSIMSPSSSSSGLSDPAQVGPSTGSAGAIPDMLHPALDDEEMAEIRSIGEKHQIEWDDTLNLVKSAWWLKFLKSTVDEFGNNKKENHMKGVEERENSNEDESYHPFGEFMEFPAWLSANESFLQQHLDDCCPDEYWKDTSLPWMDIGDIDGMDDEWLS